MTDLVGHFLVFVAGGILIGLVPLLLGRLLRPQLPSPEKEATYECGEPTIGSSYIQFDIRFYTVALLFIIFDVEVAFFFPWAAVYGGSMQLAHADLEPSVRVALSEKLLNQPAGSLSAEKAIAATTATKLGWTALADIFVFFGVLLVGFAYVWKRGDLNWVRAIAQRAKRPTPAVAPPIAEPTSPEPQLAR